MAGLEPAWPAMFGYDWIVAKPAASLIATVGDDPLLVAGGFGAGRAVAFASDCGPTKRRPPAASVTVTLGFGGGITGWADGAG